jgi:hypothetical protein
VLSLSLLFAFLPSIPNQPPPVLTPPVVKAPPAVSGQRRVLTPSDALRRGMVKLAPQEAVMKAADAAPRGVYGVFEMEVSRAEQVGPNFFLNSEKDYRDQRNLSIAIGPHARDALLKQLGADLNSALMGKKIRVVGYAKRIKIGFTVRGRFTDKYYYQTHVPIGDARQIEIVG